MEDDRSKRGSAVRAALLFEEIKRTIMTTISKPQIDYGDLIKEDRVHGRLYHDQEVFEEEFEKIWHKQWLFVGHESEVAEPGDYRTKQMGRYPVIMVRDEDGEINLLLNRCVHRGNIVCQNEQGNANAFRCAYHGWTYSNKGDLLGATFVRAYGDSFRREDMGLKKVPRVGSYRGLIFASLSPTGPTLEEHLGRVTEYLDEYIDPSPVGELQMRAGVQKARYRGNWKMMAENSLEGNYHGHFIHQFIFNVNKARSGNDFSASSNDMSPDVVISLPGGHMVEDFRPDREKAQAASLTNDSEPESEAMRDYIQTLEKRLGKEKAQRLVREGTPLIFVFPNLIMIHPQLRVLQPISPRETYVYYNPTTLKGAPEEVNLERLRHQERSYGPGGFISADDLEICERNQLGMEARVDEWLELKRGLHREKVSSDGVTLGYGTDESNLRGMWRHYKKVMSAA